jgi:hypothetical protein
MAPGTIGDNVNSWVHVEAQVSLSAVLESVQESNPSSMDHDTTEPLAIVGLSLKFPQEAVTEDEFWGILMQQKDTSTVFPDDRLSGSAIYHPDSRRRGTVSTCTNLMTYEFTSGRALTSNRSPSMADISSRRASQRLIALFSRFLSPKQLR